MKVLTIVGARPQFIKAAVVSRAIEEYNKTVAIGKTIQEIIVHTGQHYDDNMSEQFFREMQIPEPAYRLGIGGGMHGAMTGRMLEALESVLLKERPDLVMVYGDTNSTLSGALAAAKLHIPIAHVEAGLRSHNMNMPEEINRILTDRISSWLFCPTEKAIDNLQREGADEWPGAVMFNVGDVMFDAALFYRKRAVPGLIVSKFIDHHQDGFYLVTVHREGNTDDPQRLRSIMTALENIAERIPVVMPLHPRTRKQLAAISLNLQRVFCIEPVGYFDMLCLLDSCTAVFTDSGGVQKEAYFFSKPCITLRDETEWVELVDAGYNCLVGSEPDMIMAAEKNFLCIHKDFSVALYGDGKAGNKIIERILQWR